MTFIYEFGHATKKRQVFFYQITKMNYIFMIYSANDICRKFILACKMWLCEYKGENLIIFLIIYLCLIYFLTTTENLKPSFLSFGANISIPQIKSSRQTLTKHQATILLWTKVYLMSPQNFNCGPYKCYVTRNRSLLNTSNIIVFNARFAKGKENSH